MTFPMINLAPTLLTLFMLLLAAGPLALAWQDTRRRAQENLRLRELRREARITAGLRAQQPVRHIALEWDGTARP